MVAALKVTNGGEGRGGTGESLTTYSTPQRINFPQILIEQYNTVICNNK